MQVFIHDFFFFGCCCRALQVGLKNQINPDRTPLSREKALKLIRDAFTAATERDIYTGDFLEVHTITKAGVATELFHLKKD